MSAGDRGDPRPLSPQGQPSLTGTGHPVHAFVLPRRSVRAAEWYQSEPPAPCGVQTAACVKPSPPAGGGGCRRKAAGGASRNACLWTNLRSPRGGGADTEGFLALRCDRANHLGAQGGSRSHRWFSEGASYDEPQSRGSRRTPPRHGAARNGSWTWWRATRVGFLSTGTRRRTFASIPDSRTRDATPGRE